MYVERTLCRKDIMSKGNYVERTLHYVKKANVDGILSKGPPCQSDTMSKGRYVEGTLFRKDVMSKQFTLK